MKACSVSLLGLLVCACGVSESRSPDASARALHDAGPGVDATTSDRAIASDSAAGARDVSPASDVAPARDETVGGGTCDKEGGLYCGGDGVGGDPRKLYVCHGGALQVQTDCGQPCQRMPLGTPDQCPSAVDVPASVVSLIDSTPYVEENCQPTTYPGWPFDAQECTYSSGGLTATVKVADPSAERAAAWVVDSASYIPALAALKGANQAQYEDGLQAIALAMLEQSSRIFPLTGGIIEDMGGQGYFTFMFEKGVTTTCSTGCYCRINSLQRTDWCSYRAGLGDSYDACINTVGTMNYTDGWGNECLANHVAAWNSDANEHFRARAFVANQKVSAACPPGTCTPDAVVSNVKLAYQ